MDAHNADYVACPTCGLEPNPRLPGQHLCSGMRPLTEAERKAVELPPEVRADLEARIMEMDRCRARAAVDARFAWIG